MGLRRATGIGIVLLSLGLSGCGTRVLATTPIDAVGMSVAPRNNYETPVSPQDQQLARSIVNAVDQAYDQLQGFSGTLETIDQTPDKQSTGEAKIAFLKPSQTRIDVISDSGNPGDAGTKVYWDGGSSVKVRTSGLLSFMTITLSLTDSRLESYNGYTLQQLNVTTIIKALNDPQAVLKSLGDQQVDGRTVTVLDLSGVAIAPGVDHLHVGIDHLSRLPILVEFYQGSQLTYGLRIDNLSTQAPQPQDLQI